MWIALLPLQHLHHHESMHIWIPLQSGHISVYRSYPFEMVFTSGDRRLYLRSLCVCVCMFTILTLFAWFGHWGNTSALVAVQWAVLKLTADIKAVLKLMAHIKAGLVTCGHLTWLNTLWQYSNVHTVASPEIISSLELAVGHMGPSLGCVCIEYLVYAAEPVFRRPCVAEKETSWVLNSDPKLD